MKTLAKAASSIQSARLQSRLSEAVTAIDALEDALEAAGSSFQKFTMTPKQ